MLKRVTTFRKPCFIRTQKSQNVNIKSKKNKINKTKDAVGAFPIKNKKKVIYIKPATNKELYERRIVKRFRESHLISKFSSWKIM